jgi:hypothetical protein
VRVNINGTIQSFAVGSFTRIFVNAGDGADSINLDNTPTGVPVNITGGNGDDTLVLAGTSHVVNNIGSNVTFDGGAGKNTLSLDDASNATASTYQLDVTSLYRRFSPSTAFYSNVEHIVITPGTNNDVVNIDALAFGTDARVNGSPGDDDVELAPISFNLDNIGSGVFVSGASNAGVDRVHLHDSSNIASDTWNWGDNEITRFLFGGLTYSVGIENLSLDAGSGSSRVNVLSTLAGTTNTINCGGGNDDVRISPIDLDSTSAFGGAIVVDGQGDSGAEPRDSLMVNDQNTGFDDNWTVTETTIDKADSFPTAPLVTYNGFEHATLNGGNGATHYDVNIPSGTTAVAVNSGGGQDTVTVNATTLTPVTVDGQGGLDHVNVNTDNFGFADVRFANTQHLKDLNIGQGGVSFVEPGGDKVLVTSFLTMATTGFPAQLDLYDNDMIVGGAPGLAAIQGLINTARHGGDWSGLGITSTSAKNRVPRNTTLGAMSGADYHALYGAGATFDGESFGDGAVLVKYTYYGDTDFNGRVNFDDYVRTDNGFNNHTGGWRNGDFDGNGQVNFDDYVLIDLAFNSQSGTLGRSRAGLGRTV